MKKYYYILFWLLLCINCTVTDSRIKQIKYLDFEFKDQIEVEFGAKETLPPVKAKWYEFQDSTIAYLDYKNQSIRLWSLASNSVVDSINMRIKGRQYIQDFHFISPDSILLAFNSTFWGTYHDSVLLVMDRNKNRLGTLSFKNAPTLLKHGESTGTEDNWSYSDYTYFPVFYNAADHSAWASFASYSHEYCDSAVTQNQPVITGKVYWDQKNDFQPIDVQYPCFGAGEYYPINMKYLRGDYDTDQNLLMSLGNTSKLYYYDNSKAKLSEVYSPFINIDTILPKKEEYNDFWDKSKAEYLNIYFDANRNGWWRMARLPVKENDPLITRNYPRYVIQFLNHNLQKVGEGILPFGTKPPILFKEDGLLIYDEYNSEKHGRIIFQNLEVQEELMTNEEIAEKIKQEVNQTFSNPNKVEYLKQKTSVDEIIDGHFLFIPLQKTCASCLSGTQNFLLNKKDEFKSANISLVLMASNESLITDYISTGLNDASYQIIKELSTDYLHHFQDWQHMKYIVIKNDKIIFEEIYNPSKLGDLFELINEHATDSTRDGSSK